MGNDCSSDGIKKILIINGLRTNKSCKSYITIFWSNMFIYLEFRVIDRREERECVIVDIPHSLVSVKL